ncbi:disulfide bond formation protein B [Anaplasma capra]|uniref:disulfide bond formation protein B n=1 Tax=Anaplasma capra TaxID=1562740 RepID=UPI0021D60FE0|nr:disulfide bond formation protein B [Anaplasma capra]MCU7611390.1 disulfide bond formation protein B [Anaplasma capra]MCU7612465.1 disulfide bond formation protein B [Anaplasma capra]
MRGCGALLFISTVLALAVAYIGEFVYGLVPCRLCLYERVPYFVALLFSAISVLKGDKYSFFFTVACYVGGIALSVYHVGLEYGLFTDFLQCADGLGLSSNIDEIKRDLLNKDVAVSCRVPGAVFLGLSISGWNVVYAVLCVSLAFAVKKHGFKGVYRIAVRVVSPNR